MLRSVRVEFVPQELFRALVSEASEKNNSTSLWLGIVAKDAAKDWVVKRIRIPNTVFVRITRTKPR